MVLAIIGVSYATFNFQGLGSKVNTITTDAITMSYEESDNTISLNGALPTTDKTGMVRLNPGEYFDFTVSSSITGNVNINYEISAKDVTLLDGNQKKIDGKYIKLYLTKLNGDEELSGIWVGKFETSSSNPSASDGGGNTTELDPMIKPNITSWRSINVSNAFNASLKMNDEGNRYGFSSNADTHMMKNSEWAVVAYLSQSKYGKLGNENFTGSNKKVYQNKSNEFITGCSWGAPNGGTEEDYGCKYTYDININGTGASTTGTIYGVYDMSGGSWEYVMGNCNNVIGNSGFVTTPESKYYNKYMSNNASMACNESECLSHGLSEIAGWYSDSNSMVSNDYSWLIRGGIYNNNNSSPGIFNYYPNNWSFGSFDSNISFRLVISPSI